jgi:membrane protein
MKLINQLKEVRQIAKTVMHQFFHDGCLNRSVSLAYATLLSLVPLLTVSFSVLAAFPIFRDLGIKIQNLIFENVIATSAQTIQNYFINFISQTSKLPIAGMVFLLVTAVLLVFSMEKTFNLIWRVRKNREGMTAFLLYWAVITLIPIAIASVVGTINYLLAISSIAKLPPLAPTNFLAAFLPYLGALFAFNLLYLALPNCHVPFKCSFVAALIATVLFEIARKAFVYFVAYVANYTLIYGAVATVPIFLVWLYISWVVILFGVVVNYVLASKSYKTAQ